MDSYLKKKKKYKNRIHPTFLKLFEVSYDIVPHSLTPETSYETSFKKFLFRFDRPLAAGGWPDT
jgi:hypothetical protein